MAFFSLSPLGERILIELRLGSLESSVLLKRLNKSHPPVTKQGMYRALRALRSQEMVFLHAGEVSLNVRWLRRLERFVTLAQHAYTDVTTGAGNFLHLQDGERITYSFKNPVLVDSFWNHVLYILFEAYPELDEWYAYASHCWFLLAHRKEELALHRFMVERGCRVLFTVGHRTPLDRLVAEDFDGEMTQYHMRDTPLFPKKQNRLGVVLNVFGDYVIQAEYDASLTKRIEAFYAENTVMTPILQKELEDIVRTPSRTTLVILKSARKADGLRKRLRTAFHRRLAK